MALLTHKVSSCTDNYSLFAKETAFYGIPYLDKSRSSIPSDASSLLDKARSLRDSVHDASIICSRKNAKTVVAKARASNLDQDANSNKLDQNNPLPILTTLAPFTRNNSANTHSSNWESPSQSIGHTSSPSFVTAKSINATAIPTPSILSNRSCVSEKNPYVFHKWMKTMIRKPKHKRQRLPFPGTDAADPSSVSSYSSWSDKQPPSSSNNYVTKVQSATISSFPMSIESTSELKCQTSLDPATIERMSERKHALEELITTEEYYIRDLRSLKDQYLPILRDCVWISSDVRQAMARNVTEMLELHSTLLEKIARALPCTTQMIQGHGIDVHTKNMDRYPILADPSAASEVAKAFDATIMAFFVYEEYSGKYQEVMKAPKRSDRSSEAFYGKGAEALIGATNSWDNRGDYGKRAMELYDMLFKPIQRLCKYPLLFRDIEVNTPAIDCPDTNRLLEKLRYRLDEAIRQVNVANSDQNVRERIGKTWLLQDRLVFQEKSLPVRLLGHVSLCSAIHVTWQSVRESYPRSEYMACILFKSHLIFATVPKPDHYKVKFAITLAVARLEESSHGKGLYSPEAPHTWKIVFEANHRIYEVLCTACSEEEETVWRNQIQDRIVAENKDYLEYGSDSMDFCSSISSDLRPVGDVMGRPGTLARNQSLVRGASSAPLESDGQYIVINNFLFTQDPQMNIGNSRRSYSAPSFNGLVPIVNLKRSERNRIEIRLADVWTKDQIAFNATRLSSRKDSNGSVMRRLSTMSLLSTGSRKSMNSTSSQGSTTDVSLGVDYDNGECTVQHPVARSFSRSKTNLYKSAPPSPTKRSSSLRRFSFNPGVKKETCPAKSASVATVPRVKRRSIMPLLDNNKWRASPLCQSDGTINEDSTIDLPARLLQIPDRWEREEGSLSIPKPSTPPNSIQEEETTFCTVVHVPRSVGVKRAEQKLDRRHTIVVPVRSRQKPCSGIVTERKKPRSR